MNNSKSSRVSLREIRNGPNLSVLEAYLDTEGNLEIEGHDLGPATSSVSGDGEYEYFYTINRDDLPRLIELLGGQPSENVLALLERNWSGEASSELERRLQESGIETHFYSWSG